tara:strand:+ start:220 stop:540 length:321 start_codon:yes stop_codon:yes gene_type:complete
MSHRPFTKEQLVRILATMEYLAYDVKPTSHSSLQAAYASVARRVRSMSKGDVQEMILGYTVTRGRSGRSKTVRRPVEDPFVDDPDFYQYDPTTGNLLFSGMEPDYY